jgi:hypothetical protein
MRATLAKWETDGRRLDPAICQSLLSQALAVDLALAAQHPWHIGNALSVMQQLLRGYGLLNTDPFESFEAFMKEMISDDPPVKIVEKR